MRTEHLKSAGKKILELASHYKGQGYSEMRIDGLVYGVLNERFKVTRQYHVCKKNNARPKRIDFRQGGSNPALIEFAVRTSNGSGVYGCQNRDELHKLEKHGYTKAKARFLLLLDVSKTPVTRDDLKNSYSKIKRSRGRGCHENVRIVYVHLKEAYSFRWPLKTNIV